MTEDHGDVDDHGRVGDHRLALSCSMGLGDRVFHHAFLQIDVDPFHTHVPPARQPENAS
jgi:hypothetical protein